MTKPNIMAAHSTRTWRKSRVPRLINTIAAVVIGTGRNRTAADSLNSIDARDIPSRCN